MAKVTEVVKEIA